MNHSATHSHSDPPLSGAVVSHHLLQDDGTFPNSRLPLLVYQGIIDAVSQLSPAWFEERFSANKWSGSWRNGIYAFHHYHSTAHEALGVYAGTATVQFGGKRGVVLAVGPGDVVVIPAGVAHKNLGASQDFRVVGAYPGGGRPDMNSGKPAERPVADQNIAQLPLPEADPVYGTNGPLQEHWRT